MGGPSVYDGSAQRKPEDDACRGARGLFESQVRHFGPRHQARLANIERNGPKDCGGASRVSISVSVYVLTVC